MIQLKTAIDLQHLMNYVEELVSPIEIPIDSAELQSLILRIDKAETQIAELQHKLLPLELKASLVESK